MWRGGAERGLADTMACSQGRQQGANTADKKGTECRMQGFTVVFTEFPGRVLVLFRECRITFLPYIYSWEITFFLSVLVLLAVC